MPLASVQEISREAGLRSDSARRKIARYRDAGILTPRVLVNTFPLGLERYSLFGSLGEPNRRRYERLITSLINAPQVSLVLELSGDYEFEVNLTVSNQRELRDFLEQLSAKHGMHFTHKALGIQLGHSIFGTRCIAQRRKPFSPLIYSDTDEIFLTDELDTELLSESVRIGTVDPSPLARSLNEPVSTVSYRLRRLKEAHVLMGLSFLVHINKLHHYVVLVYLKSFSEDLRIKLSKFCKKEPNVFYSVDSIGSWDFELGITTVDPTLLIDTLRNFQSEFGDSISQTKVLNILNRRLVRDFS